MTVHTEALCGNTASASSSSRSGRNSSGECPGNFRLVKMPPDGNCLFHALSRDSGEEASALRNEVADFLEEQAAQQEEHEDAWLDEAAMLRGDPEECWGGDVSVLAWSLLRERRTQVHWRDCDGDCFRFDERTHWQVLDNMADPDKHPVLHLLCNGINHYDLLLPDSSTDPADQERPAARPTAHAAQGRQTGESGGSHSSAWVSGEVPDAMMAKQGVLAELSLYNVAEQSSHPHQRLEDLLSKLAAQRLRDSPTLPPHASSASLDAGEAWPRIFCAFNDCAWCSEHGDEEELLQHLHQHHLPQLEPLLQLLPDPNAQDALLSIYNEAVAIKCRSQAPLAGSSLDRTALRSFARATSADRAEALICFSCACIHTRVAETEDAGNIKWHRPLQRAAGATSATFLGRPLSEIANILGLDSFLEKYDRLEGDLKLTTFEDFAHWRVRLPSNDGGEDGHFLLCCPEDHRCAAHPQHVAEGCLCEQCEVPLCGECHQRLKAGKLPPLSLCNDMWTGYAPERLYAENVTVMEMICASPCVTTLICMSMEARYRSDSSSLEEKIHPLDEKVHMARHRLGARGNALTFPLAWEDLLRKLQAHHGLLDSEANQEAPTQLPRSGPALGEVVRVLLKTNKTGKTSDAEIKSLIHQAVVRREVVVRLILDMKQLGHPAYQSMEEASVRRAAAALPEEGVPPEVLKVIGEIDEQSEDRLQPQKAATPSDAFHELDEAGAVFASQRARAVVPEGCSIDQQDQNAVGVQALNELADQVKPSDSVDRQEGRGADPPGRAAAAQTFEVRTGNKLIDQFQPMYFATAFCFCFKHATACPDVQNTATAQDRTNFR